MYNLLKKATLATFILCAGCNEPEKSNPNFQQEAANPEFLHRSLEQLTSVVKHDLFGPMIASRIYAYSHIAMYEALNSSNLEYKTLAGQIAGLTNLPKPEAGKTYCYPLASVKAYLRVGKKLIFSEDSITQFETKILKEFKQIGIPKDVFERSLAFGDTVAGSIIAWSGKDNYLQTRSAPKYTVTFDNPSRWRPTAPDYADAAEPHWNKIRSLTLDSASQFKPIRPTPFDINPNSLFYKQAFEVAKSVADSTPERISIARYWDDSPMATQNAGHVNFIIKKVTPGGHWLHIAKAVCRQLKVDNMKASAVYAQMSIAIFDGFISCWDEKYRSEVVRPETYITKYMKDKQDWTPILVTPPFPEYPSGHSVISGAASTLLNHFFGDTLKFTDDTEVQFNMGTKEFPSFNAAADEAAISRMYGGIHYMPAITIGVAQGRNIGKHILGKIKLN
jgi:PAP2 superfamily